MTGHRLRQKRIVPMLTEKQHNSILASILSRTGSFLVLLIMLAALPLSLPGLAGVRVFGVLSESMEPEYAAGGVIYVKPCDTEKLQMGDVITYRLGSDTDAVMTHRIVSVNSQTASFCTKGDANDSVDPEPVHPEQIVGKVVFYLPAYAPVAYAMEKPEGIMVILIVLFLAVVCWMLADIVRVQTKDMLRPVLRGIAVVLMTGSICYLGSIFLQYQACDSEYSRLKKQVFEEREDDGTYAWNDEESRDKPEKQGKMKGRDEVVQNAVAHLMQSNDDMIGWIAFDYLDISYPVMQGEDNEYYLHHTFSGQENPGGSIFMDAINHGSWEDAHTVVYGHNMKDRSMFGQLRCYRTKEFYEKNAFFSIYTGRETWRYQIFSCYDVPEDSDIYTVWYTADKNFEKMIVRMQEQAAYETGVEVNAEDQILTLSTCSAEGKRFVIHAKRLQ